VTYIHLAIVLFLGYKKERYNATQIECLLQDFIREMNDTPKQSKVPPITSNNIITPNVETCQIHNGDDVKTTGDTKIRTDH
jgi:hypothetical protein